MWKRILFQRSGGHYLFWVSVIYLTAGLIDIFLLEEDYVIFIQFFWLLCLTMPLIIKPFARWLNMKTIWEFK